MAISGSFRRLKRCQIDTVVNRYSFLGGQKPFADGELALFVVAENDTITVETRKLLKLRIEPRGGARCEVVEGESVTMVNHTRNAGTPRRHSAQDPGLR